MSANLSRGLDLTWTSHWHELPALQCVLSLQVFKEQRQHAAAVRVWSWSGLDYYKAPVTDKSLWRISNDKASDTGGGITKLVSWLLLRNW
jgi:hypothetical protein